VKQATGSFAPALVGLGILAISAGLSVRSLQNPGRHRSWRLPSLAGVDDI
jgi:hypothetical protein